MSVALWAIVAGLLLIAMAISTSLLNRSGVAEVVVLASLFTSGLKLRAPLARRRWSRPVRGARQAAREVLPKTDQSGWAGLSSSWRTFMPSLAWP